MSKEKATAITVTAKIPKEAVEQYASGDDSELLNLAVDLKNEIDYKNAENIFRNFIEQQCEDDSNQHEVYSLECRPEDYPNITSFKKLERGDVFVIRDNGEKYRAGDRVKDYPATVLRILYYPKKWWQFWKKKKPFAYIISWEGTNK